jgi:ATP phosphoribosyltransferase regulatory subunit
MSKKLLPVGFYDLLFDEAEKNHHNINQALAAFFAEGYRLIKMPLVEFEDSFSQLRIENSFRVVDVISGKNLIFRNDITPQISRLFATRLAQENLPLKLCYVGDVLCAKSDNLYADRQQTQVGFEIIGGNTTEFTLEVVQTLLRVLQKITPKTLLIECCLPNFLDIFLDEIGVEEKLELSAAIRQKNFSAIRILAGKNAKIINKIASSNDDLSDLSLAILTQIKSEKIAQELKKAEKISQFLAEKSPQTLVRFDLFGDKSSYHTEISFDVFCGDFSYPVARGGCYKIDDASGVGAAIYMNRLRKL